MYEPPITHARVNEVITRVNELLTRVNELLKMMNEQLQKKRLLDK